MQIDTQGDLGHARWTEIGHLRGESTMWGPAGPTSMVSSQVLA